jgi:hypothetical protein
MINLQDLLDRRAQLIEPSFDAFDRVIRSVHKRRRRRRAVASGTLVCVLATALTAVVVAGHSQRPRARVPLAAQLLGTTQALAVRNALGIEGPTKGAPESVVVTGRTPAGHVEVSLVHVRTGRSTRVNLDGGDTKETSVSPRGDVVASVTRQGVVVASPREPDRQAVIPDTQGAEGQVSWDGTGSALFTRVRGEWLRVRNATPPGTESTKPSVERVTVPAIPGGPVLLSVSPSGDVATLFGITSPDGLPPVPHLYVGRFDGSAITDPREIDIPAGALAGPMGWVGDNAFLLAPKPGKALVIRTDGSRVEVSPEGIEDPCRTVPTDADCRPEGPSLLGTNADGSLLFWRISAERTPDRSAPAILVLYYKTWLDGTHGVRLGGLAGRFGPPVAPR